MTEQEENQDQLLTLAQVARRLNVPIRTLYNGKSTGRLTLKLLNVGGRLRCRESDLEAWLEECRVGKAAELSRKGEVIKTKLFDATAAVIERIKADLDALGGMIGHNDHTATIFDALEYLGETITKRRNATCHN